MISYPILVLGFVPKFMPIFGLLTLKAFFLQLIQVSNFFSKLICLNLIIDEGFTYGLLRVEKITYKFETKYDY